MSNHIDYTDDQIQRSIDQARRLFEIEVEAVNDLSARIETSFRDVIKLLLDCKGKVIVTGLGKSGIAGQKIAATLASTGVPALFLHAAEAIHGDMGVASKGDVAIALSYSGETGELIELIPQFKLKGIPVIALTGKPESALGKIADQVVDVSVRTYPFPFGIVPTASLIATIAVGDAIAIALMTVKGFKEDDFAVLHPGGLLGKRMLAKVESLMHTGNELPIVLPDTTMSDVLVEMTAKRLGVACVVSPEGILQGVITDGDLRRLLSNHTDPLGATAEAAMTKDPTMIQSVMLAAKALNIMEERSITSLPVVDKDNLIVGLIHMHDIIKVEVSH